MFWIGKFTGLQFTVVFRKFYDTLLGSELHINDAADFHVSFLSRSKFVIHPFISIQKEFGYSDVTKENNNEGRVERLFKETSGGLESLKKVRKLYLPDFKK